VTLVGVDVGTSAVKVLVLDERGRRLARVRRILPPLVVDPPAAGRGRASPGSVTQDPVSTLEEVERALAAVDRVGRWSLIALTTQRDTLLLTDGSERPLTPLVSWRDARDRHAPLLDSLLAGLPPSGDSSVVRVRSLASWLSSVWTGRAAETPATLPRHLSGPGLRDGKDRLGTDALPDLLSVGAEAGRRRGVPVHVTAGDKNCEMLGAGVRAPGRAALSMGSAISLGMITDEGQGRPPDASGRVVTPAALPGRWNVETGLVIGMDGLDRIDRWLGSKGDRWLDPGFQRVPVLRPWFAPALDGAGSGVMARGLERLRSSDDVRQAWAQGVVSEVARLAPSIEEAVEHTIGEVVLSGGGGTEAAWTALVAAALDVPVRRADDPWRAARGAIVCALLATDRNEAAESILEAGEIALGDPHTATRAQRASAMRWMRSYDSVVKEG